jgi:hypothetical protein
VVINYDGTVPAAGTTIAALTIDATNTHHVSLFLNTSLTVTGTEVVGLNGAAGLALLAGTHSAAALTIGQNGPPNGGNSGTVLLSGAVLLTNDITVGANGYGTLSEDSGSLSTSNLTMGTFPDGAGTCTLTGGSFLVTSNWTVGAAESNGVVNQSGGVATANALTLGASVGGGGIYNFSNGATLNVSKAAVLGLNGLGVFTQSGGQANFNGGLILARVALGAGDANRRQRHVPRPRIPVCSVTGQRRHAQQRRRQLRRLRAGADQHRRADQCTWADAIDFLGERDSGGQHRRQRGRRSELRLAA